MPRVLVIGDTTIDHFMTLSPEEAEPLCEVRTHENKLLIPYGEKLPVTEYESLIAGNAPNAVVTAARLGLESAIWTVMGNDLIGQEAKRYLAREGVDTSHLELVDGEASNVSVVLRVLAERTILVYHYPRVYNLPDVDHASWVYLTSMAKGWEAIISKLISHLDSSGAKLVFQPGTYQLKSGHVAARELLHRTHLFICNKEEAIDYLNLSNEASIRQLLVGLHTLGPKIIVITDGINGSYASDGTDNWFLGVRQDIKRIEATGAGDAYASALMVALVHNQPLNQAMLWGNVNAESVIGYVGAQRGILTMKELEERLEEGGQVRAEVL